MHFESLKDIQIHCSHTVAEAMECISRNINSTGGYGLALVIDNDERLAGVVTDGDIRRALLSEYTLDSSVDLIMQKKPITTTPNKSYHQLLRLFERNIKHIPVIDDSGHIIDLLLYDALVPDVTPVGSLLRAKAPLRISFAGGGTDMTHVIESLRGEIISATIDRYCYADLVLRNDSKIVLHSADFDQTVTIPSFDAIKYDGNLDLLKAAIRVTEPKFGLDLHTSSDVLPGSGLGGSASLSVAIIGLIEHIRTGYIDEYRVADLAFQAERVELGIRGGWQDQYAAVFGGLNYMEFDKEGVVVHPLRLNDRTRSEIESNTILCFTGQTRHSGDIHSEIDSNISKASSGLSDEYSAMLRLVEDVREALLKGNLVKFGYLLDKTWLAKREMKNGISNSKADELYNLAKEHGALGGKLLGAGGGGYMLFYCDALSKHRVKKALQIAGAEPVTFNLDFQGLRIWPSEKALNQTIHQNGL